jgi:VIT1/CCC1 family predicted Fe2+/Mn2+ transporter
MNVNQPEENVVAGLYDNYHETQKEILAIEIRKTRNKLITIALVVFIFDMIALLVSNAVLPETILWISVIPVLILVLAFFAMKEPLAAMIIAAVIIVGIWVYSIVLTGGLAAISGWLSKAIIIYLLIAGFQHAREATRIKKELKGAI